MISLYLYEFTVFNMNSIINLNSPISFFGFVEIHFSYIYCATHQLWRRYCAKAFVPNLDTYVPYLAMNYFDRYVSRNQMAVEVIVIYILQFFKSYFS